MTRYVQHKSGVGEKWEVMNEEPLIYRSYDRGIPLSLPKSEYVEVPPPEQWQDVTEECAQQTYGEKLGPLGEYVVYRGDRLAKLLCNGGYRLRKVHVPNHGSGLSCYFIVEKRVQP